MDFIYAQVGFARTWFLVITTFVIVAIAHVVSIRTALAGQTLNWKERPLKSIWTVAVREQVEYHKKVPLMIGAIILLVIGVCYL